MQRPPPLRTREEDLGAARFQSRHDWAVKVEEEAGRDWDHGGRVGGKGG